MVFLPTWYDRTGFTDLRNYQARAEEMPCPTRSPILRGRLLKSGAHVNAVGGCTPQFVELDVDCVRRSKLYCDSLTSCLNEPGEIVNPGRGFPVKNILAISVHF